MKAKLLLSLSGGLIILVIWLGLSPAAQAVPQDCTPTTQHNGWITSDETWCLATGSVHTVSDYVAVQTGVTVTIEPGVTVKTANHIYVDGDLQAVGTAVQPILFTSTADSGPGEWQGMEFRSGTGHLRYVTLRYASDYTILAQNIQAGELLIENSQIMEGGRVYWNRDEGIRVSYSHVTITDTTFSGLGTDGYPLYIVGSTSAVTLTNNTFSNNFVDRVYLYNDAMNGQNVTLTPQNGLEGYEFGSWVIPAGRTLTVEPGVTLMGSDTLYMDGNLQAVGTAVQPILFTSAANSAPNEWNGLRFRGGDGHLRHVTVRYGHDANIAAENIQAGELLIEDSQIIDAGSVGIILNGGFNIYNSNVTVRRTEFSDLGAWGYAVAVIGELSHVTIEESRILHSHSGLLVFTADQVHLRNVAFSDLAVSGVVVRNNGTLSGEHVTLSNIASEALWVYELNSTATLTNSIITLSGTGARTDAYSAIMLDTVLLTQNEADAIGQVTETNPIPGPSGLMADGYHLTRYSAAIGQANSGVVLDIDGDARPLPAGTQPDLGADEYLDNPLDVFDAEKTAFTPVWLFTSDPITGDPVAELQQDYLLRYAYGSPAANPPALAVTVADTLPAELNYVSDTHSPAMTFTQLGQALTWDVTQPVQKDDSGEIILRTNGAPTAGQTLWNTAVITAGADVYSLPTSSVVPLIAPILLTPGTGEYCSRSDNSVTLHGFAQPDVMVRVYENGTLAASQAVTDGEFNISYASTHVGIDPTTLLEVRACTLTAPETCSSPTTLTLKEPQSFWCPQESRWEGTPTAGPLAGQHLVYGFRDATGEFSSQNWQIRGVYGFWDTDLTLTAGYCPDTAIPPTAVWVIADGTHYDPQPGGGPVYHFDITGGAHNVTIASNCDEVFGVILIDPDGYVFDSTLGFDPDNPTAHVLPGATVTAYEYVPATDNWRPWPAHLYNDQINPQVVGENGYFAFFTPPGHYYLQVAAPAGYQSWRSPVIEVVNEIVHANAPLTPVTATAVQNIPVDESALSLPQVTIFVGQSVTWTADDSWLAPDQYISLSENPMQRILSELDPLADVLGFDSGHMIPGQTYSRRFVAVGTYEYTDGYGRSGQVVVRPFQVLLPLVVK